MKDKIFGVLQRVGRSFMLPIAILPVAGLLLGVGGSFTNETTLQTYGLMGIMGPGTVLNAILQVMSSAGDIVFVFDTTSFYMLLYCPRPPFLRLFSVSEAVLQSFVSAL